MSPYLEKRRGCATAPNARLYLHRPRLVRTRCHDPGIMAGKAGHTVFGALPSGNQGVAGRYPLGVRNSLSTPHVYELGVIGEAGFNRRASELLPGPRRSQCVSIIVQRSILAFRLRLRPKLARPGMESLDSWSCKLPILFGLIKLTNAPGLGFDLGEEELEKHPGVSRRRVGFYV
jgi:hypothetical protein